MRSVIAETTTTATADLNTHHRNPRRGDVKIIAESLDKNGQYRAIVVNRGTLTGRPNEVLAGNHTLLAARELGWATIEATFVDVDVDDDAATRIVLADNRTADRGTYDHESLMELLNDLPDLVGTGYTADDLDLEPTDSLTEPDDVPDTPDAAVSRLGDVWHLGPHRLLVGSAADLDAVLNVTGEHGIDAIWTDPPYGISYVGKTANALTIQNDGGDDAVALWQDTCRTLWAAARPGAPFYVAHAPSYRTEFLQALLDNEFIYRQDLVWVKNTFALGHGDYHRRHEPILYGNAPGTPADDPETLERLDAAGDPETYEDRHDGILYGFAPNGKGRLGRGGPNWHGDNKQSTVFEVNKPARNADHPTMKPVELIEAMLRNSVPRGGTVLDTFGGSGSTLIAAHRLGIRARLVELDTRYADVICRRYQEHTGDIPRLNGTEPHDFTAPLEVTP